MLLMGGPFLLLPLNGSLPLFALVILVFVIGEMLWVPTSQSIVAGLAPEDLRGAYMGAFGSTAAFGFALGPFVGLQLRDTLRRRRWASSRSFDCRRDHRRRGLPLRVRPCRGARAGRLDLVLGG